VIRQLGPNLDLAPADIALSASELGLTTRLGRETVLHEALNTVAANYDVCLIDCPPSLAMLAVNALVAADGVLCPTQPTTQDLRGLMLFLSTMKEVQRLNPDLRIIGVVPTFFDAHLLHHRDAMEAMQNAGMVLLSPIGRSVRVAEAASAYQPVVTFAPDNPQAENYRLLAEDVKQWLNAASEEKKASGV
jgi:chromosome partitioning protein